MKNLLVLKETVKIMYSRYQVYLKPLAKFMLAFVALSIINGQLGYMQAINSVAVVLIVALMASFLPNNFSVLAVLSFVLLHFYAVSIESAAVGLVVFLLMLLLYFRFTPNDTLVVLLLPICFAMKIPFVIPIAVGLLATPISVFSVICATIIYYLIMHVQQNATLLSVATDTSIIENFRLVVDGVAKNKAMFVTILVFTMIVLIVYFVRRQSMEHAWTMAIVAGGLIGAIVMLIADLILDTNISIMATIFGSAISIGIAMVIKFFAFNVDYSRIEKVQFEDDEYYYYVKAIPKITVSRPQKQIHKINENKRTVKIPE
jgi:hypothetical protein